jgi:subtilisin family serine protease
VVATVAVGLWAVAVAVGAETVGWLVAQLQLATGLDQPAWQRPAPSLVAALLVGLPAALLAAVPPAPAVRAAGRAWLLGAATLGGLGLLRAVPMPQNEIYLAAVALFAASAAALLGRLTRTGERRGRTGPVAAGLAVIAGLVVLLPWVWLGALGGLLETALAVTAAASVGWLAATILDRRFWTAYQRWPDHRPHPVRLVLLGGLVAGVTLLLLAAGTGQDGAQLAAMLVLPPLGFAGAALWPLAGAAQPLAGAAQPAAGAAQPAAGAAEAAAKAPAGGRYPALGWLIGVALAGPLAFADPEEISLLLAPGRDVPFWTAVAAGGSLAVALLVGIGYAVTFARSRPRSPGRRLVAAALGVLLLGAGGLYVGAGQPGLHGEKLFVVLTEQADLTGVPVALTGIAGREARGREVYRRLVDTAERSQADLRRELRRLHLRYTPYYLVNAIEVDGGPAVREWLGRRGEVARVLLSQQLRPLPAPPEPDRGRLAEPAGAPWNITMIGADRVRSQLGVTGSGIVVGSSDSGVDGGHPALAGGFRGGDDSWYDPWNGTRSPTDDGGHGTHTLATAVGGHQVGVAPGARWVGCVNLDRNLGNPAHYLDCLQFMLAPFPVGRNPFTDGRPERAPQVLTNSWGCPPIEGCDRGLLRPATAALAAAGIFFVAAAGNTGPYCGSVSDPPAPYPDVLAVGAVDQDRQVTLFSSRGPAPGGAVKPDVVAPGAGVLSALPGGGYATLDGTSMATPHVAGVVALMWSANPALVGDLGRTRQILRDTAVPVEPTYRSRDPADQCDGEANIGGAGLVDAYAAVRAARQG